MARFLLDTNVISDLIRDPDGAVVRRLVAEHQHAPCTSIVVAGELRYGAMLSSSERLSRRVEGVLDRLPVLPFEAPADRTYARLRTALRRAGLSLGANDLLIAAHALSLDLVLVTGDRAFLQVPGLAVENWLD